MSSYTNLIQKILNFSNLKTQIKLCSLCQEYYYFLKASSFIHQKNINQEIIEQLMKLKKLNTNNKNIYYINIINNILELLYTSGDCGITQEGIEQLEQLKDLFVSKNALEILNASTNECGITQEGIEQLEILKDLYVSK